ncbi:MAG: amino acid ABC transporter permease [Mycobacterium leprae]
MVQVAVQALPFLLQGALMTLKLTAIGATCGIILGTLVGLGRTSGIKWLDWLLRVYVEVLRGTPLYVQLLLVVFGLPEITGINFNEFTAAVITISINSSAYVSEIIRAGIQSIDKGQMEAARSLGMSRFQAMVRIILPQAVRRVIPPLVNEIIALIKESSLVATVAIVELTRAGTLVSSRTYQPFPVYITVALIYLCMTLTLSLLSGRLERKLNAATR